MTLHWGILGCGNIARQFATGLKALPDATLAAAGSRSQEKADKFAQEFGAAKAYGTYQALADNPDVQAIYVATPHPMHEEDALMCLAAGKAVLCEKPFTINAAQAERVIQSAREKKVFLMEAMWTRYIPLMAELRKVVKEGVIGELLMLQADFGFRAGVDPNSRLFNPALGGGGLLDVGVYPISLSSMLLGTPSQVAGVAQIGSTGVDELAGMTFLHPGGPVSVLATGVRVNTPQEATLMGSDGKIVVHGPWWKPSVMTISVNGKDPETREFPIEGNGFNYEAQEVADCLAAGKLESDVLPLDETLSIMKTMDTLRAQWGLKYPME